MDQFSRMQLLVEPSEFQRLSNSHVIIFGIGGVGGFVAEALARSGIGQITLVDPDVVEISNLNRQLVALHSTIGLPKIEVMKNRLLDINPKIIVHTKKLFYDKDSLFDLSSYSYVIDAIDTVKSKILLIQQAKMSKTKIISCMGTGNKLDPTLFQVADIFKTTYCPLARIIRRELSKINIKSLKVVYSKEQPTVPKNAHEIKSPGSFSFVPATAGLILSSEVVKNIMKDGDS